jgi:four helix bundle protein
LKTIRSFTDLVVWRKAFELCLDVYRITEGFPDRERYGMIGELRKTARSVLYNIAEGHKRASTREYIRFLDITSGSAAELETQFYLSRALMYLDDQGSDLLLTRLKEIQRMLAALTHRLKERLGRPLPSTPSQTDP